MHGLESVKSNRWEGAYMSALECVWPPKHVKKPFFQDPP